MSGRHVLNDIGQTIAEADDIAVADLSDELLASDEPLCTFKFRLDRPVTQAYFAIVPRHNLIPIRGQSRCRIVCADGQP